MINTNEKETQEALTTAFLEYLNQNQHIYANQSGLFKPKKQFKQKEKQAHWDNEKEVLFDIKQEFKLGQSYTNTFITSALQRIYNEHDLQDSEGKPKVADPYQLGELNRFVMKPCEIISDQGKLEKGYKLLGPNWDPYWVEKMHQHYQQNQ